MTKRADVAAPVADAQAAAEARVGTALDAKWTLDALLGRGGMATVYAASHKTTRARAAVKVLHREFAQDEDVSQRFLREARIANSIQHPSRVAVLDEGVSDDGEIFLVMDLLQGTTLDSYMKGPGRALSVEQKLRIFDPLLELLGECHAAGIIHRDIKPANIFITEGGQIKVLDFGIARLRETQSSVDPTRQGTILGTPAYMAPEQALGLSEMVDGRADLWSVGACVYAVLSGQRVHRARSENESMVLAATKSADSIALIMPDLPVEVVAFVDKSLAHDRAHRFPDARAMRGELGTLIAALRTGQVTSVAKSQQRGDALVVRSQVSEDHEMLASTELRSRNLERLTSIWKNIIVHLTLVQQYGPTHNAALQPLRFAHEEISQGLAERPDSLVWEISPYGFTFAKTLLWDGERALLERAAYKLFSFGLRKIQWRPGFTEEELKSLLAILVGDPQNGYKTSDDPVADLWAQRYEHVAHLAIDSFAVGNADDLEAFESEAADVAKEAFDLATITHGRDDQIFDSLEARAIQANLMGQLSQAATVAASVAVDVPTRAALRAQVDMPDDRWAERFIDVMATGLLEGSGSSSTGGARAALAAWAADQIASNQATAVFDFLASLGTALVAEPKAVLASRTLHELAQEMIDPVRLGELLRRTAADTEIDARLAEGVERLLRGATDAVYFDAALARYSAGAHPRLAGPLREYVARWASEHEAELGQALEAAEPTAAAEILALLAGMPGAAAARALVLGMKSPHTEVRLATLARLTVEHGYQEVQALLSDRSEEVRIEALRVVGSLRVRSVGPAVVRRIQLDSFVRVGAAERKAWLSCLHLLNPVRAEEIAVGMLGNAPMIRDEKNDENRVIAAEVLALAESAEALSAVKKASRPVWWNSPDVRSAAEAAATSIASRREGKGSS